MMGFWRGTMFRHKKKGKETRPWKIVVLCRGRRQGPPFTRVIHHRWPYSRTRVPRHWPRRACQGRWLQRTCTLPRHHLASRGKEDIAKPREWWVGWWIRKEVKRASFYAACVTMNKYHES